MNKIDIIKKILYVKKSFLFFINKNINVKKIIKSIKKGKPTSIIIKKFKIMHNEYIIIFKIINN